MLPSIIYHATRGTDRRATSISSPNEPVFGQRYQQMGCCDFQDVCELNDECFAELCKSTPRRDPYSGLRRTFKNFTVYDVVRAGTTTPHMLFIPNFVSRQECAQFLGLEKNLSRSVTFVDHEKGELEQSSWRTSYDTGVGRDFEPLRRIHDKM